jgi:tetratricopeptide (TPR) repeat protein
MDLDPNNPIYWYNKGNNLIFDIYFEADDAFWIGRYEEAIECYDKAIELDPSNPIYWDAKGWALYYYLERYEEALKCYDKATKLNPKNPKY